VLQKSLWDALRKLLGAWEELQYLYPRDRFFSPLSGKQGSRTYNVWRLWDCESDWATAHPYGTSWPNTYCMYGTLLSLAQRRVDGPYLSFSWTGCEHGPQDDGSRLLMTLARASASAFHW
jgi:hypothetical protein